KLNALELKIETLAGEDGKLFGSVTSLQIANKIKEQGFEIDRKRIAIEDIRETGSYVAEVHILKTVKAEIPVEVSRKEA
ncbi:MAG: 50S ribosomal protein L9, partial [Bacteroidota bacterium]